jgi:hypothetical protein
MNCEAIGVWKISGDEFEAALHKSRYHFDISGQSVEPSDHKHGAKDATRAYRLVELGAAIVPSACRFGKLCDEAPRGAIDERSYGLALCVQPQTGPRLRARRNPIVRDVALRALHNLATGFAPLASDSLHCLYRGR